jgi:hypothetical protein
VSDKEEANLGADSTSEPAKETGPQGPPAPPSAPSAPSAGKPINRWGWAILVGGLAIIGVLLVLADIAVGHPWLGLVTGRIPGGPVVSTPGPGFPLNPGRFDRSRIGEKLTFAAPFGMREPISPILAVRDFLSNGAGLILIALAALVLFPERARVAVERFETGAGPAIALAAGVVMLLLTLAIVSLLRFSLVFLAAIPEVLVIALAAALFGIACIALAIGRLLQRRLPLTQTHPLVAALAGALVIFDLAVIPYAGVVAMLAVGIAGLGLAVVTRFGSSSGWSFHDLSW